MIHSRVPGRRLLLGLAMAVVAVAATTTATAAVGTATATPIKFAIMSDCGGAFAANYEQDIGGAITAVSQFGGAKPNNPNKPSAGWHGGSVGGHPLKLVGIGCANDTADSAIKETKRLMEQLGADMMIGPLSGDESVAVANYAKQHPTKTFVNGTAGAWDTTAAVKAPNFFRFNGSGVQWQAGIGSIATKKNEEGRDHHTTASFGCVRRRLHRRSRSSGNITKRVFPPLNTTTTRRSFSSPGA
jgi:branched-chain amino acid transport system substrate-binding protein